MQPIGVNQVCLSAKETPTWDEGSTPSGCLRRWKNMKREFGTLELVDRELFYISFNRRDA